MSCGEQKLGQAHKIEIFRLLGAGLPVKCILRRGSANFFSHI